MDCKGFELKANSSKVIEIVFQTDFTVTRISKTLTLKTNLSYPVNYILVAQLPSKGLDQCTALLPRPPWEEKIRKATIGMLMITFVLVLIAVHIDYGNIMYAQSALYGAREKGHVHPTFNLRNIAMRSTNTNNNESSASEELTQRNKTSGALKKRNVSSKPNQKIVNGEVVSSSSSVTSSSFTALPNLTLAEMVSWTFGTKSSKKTNKMNKGKDNIGNATSSSMTTSNSNALSVANDAKSTKTKLNEKLLMDKMDEDLKKSQQNINNKKSGKTAEKPPCGTTRVNNEEQKPTKDEVEDKEVKKEKMPLTKINSKASANTNSGQEIQISQKEQRKCIQSSGTTNLQLELQTKQTIATPSPSSSPSASHSPLTSSQTLGSFVTPMTEITNQQTPVAKENSNGRKLGKTPGRERRKQSTQNTSPATSSCSSNSTSSSATLPQSGSASNVTGKRYERKLKTKASNSLKFSPNSNFNNGNYLYSSSAAMAAAANGNNDQTFYQDVLSPWDYNSHITFSDVLQQTQQYANSQAAEALNSSPTSSSSSSLLYNTDLMQHSTSSSLFDAVPLQSTSSTTPTSIAQMSNASQFSRGENSEISAALAPKRPLKMPNDLGPIGSRKSPSSTPAWEPLNSAIPMQLPMPLNTTIATTSANNLPYDLQHAPNFRINDLLTARQTIQQLTSQPRNNITNNQAAHDFDITHEIMRLQQLEQQLLMQQQQQQQHRQYVNYSQVLNSNWPPSTWTPFIANGGGVNGSIPTCSPSDVFVNTSTPPSSSTWSSRPILEPHYPGQHLPLNSEPSAPSIPQVSNSISSFDNHNTATNGIDTAAGGSGGLILNDTNSPDNMPMFNLFGGLSSIWNDNWKQSTQQQQPQEPSPKHD